MSCLKTTLAFLALISTWTVACTDDEGDCDDGDTQCAQDRNMVQICEDGKWEDWDDCAAQGKLCILIQGTSQCVSNGDADADSDSDVDSDTDSDADTGTDTGTGGDTDTGTGEALGWADLDAELLWQDPPDDAERTFDQAVTYCTDLSFGGYDDWRVPSVSEGRSLIRGCAVTEGGGDCGVADDCTESTCGGADCEQPGCGEMSGPGEEGCFWPADLSGGCARYWTATEVGDATSHGWRVYYRYANLASYTKDGELGVRCVRDL